MDFGDAEGSLGAVATGHQFGAEGDRHAGPRPAVCVASFVLRVDRLALLLLVAPSPEQERRAERACRETREAPGNRPEPMPLPPSSYDSLQSSNSLLSRRTCALKLARPKPLHARGLDANRKMLRRD